VGLITTALKGDAADPEHVAAAVASMKRLNRQAARLLQETGVHACTDVTGFSLLGHAWEMAERSQARLRFTFDRLPFLDGARQYAELNLFPGGACRNRDAYIGHVDFAPALSEEMRMLLFTPETSGGLLAAISPDRIDALLARFAAAGAPCWVVGEAVEGEGIEVQ